ENERKIGSSQGGSAELGLKEITHSLIRANFAHYSDGSPNRPIIGASTGTKSGSGGPWINRNAAASGLIPILSS
ncbi:hypothetical protein HKBW3S03_01425, partial [Candidatus Hakubella thermalkaliphila]